MKVDISNGQIRLTLSRRNLLSLLHKLDWPESEKTLVKGIVSVTAEDDSTHYAGRKPGPMHPATEAFIEWNTPMDQADHNSWKE